MTDKRKPKPPDKEEDKLALLIRTGIDKGKGPFGTEKAINPMDPTGPKVRRHIRGAPNLTDLWPTEADLGQGFTDLMGDIEGLIRASDQRLAKVKMVRTLGDGSYGVVLHLRGWPVITRNAKQKWVTKTREVAAKVIEMPDQTYRTYEQILDYLLSDMNALALLRHPNIVEYIDFIGIPDPKTGFPYAATVLVMEKCLGDLNDLLTLLGGPYEAFRQREVCLHWFRHIVDAVCYLHDLNVVHLDIKPDNILYTFTGAVPKRALVLADVMDMVFKLTDFGCSHSYNIDEANPTIDYAVGAFDYMCPEMRYIWKYRTPVEVKPCDVYSLGRTLFVAHKGAARKSHKIIQTCLQAISGEEKLKYFDRRIAKFVLNMSRFDPEKRLTIHEIQTQLYRRTGIDSGNGPFGTQMDINPMDPTGPKVKRHIRGAPNLTDLWPTTADLGQGFTEDIEDLLRASDKRLAKVEVVSELGSGRFGDVYHLKGWPVVTRNARQKLVTKKTEVAAKVIGMPSQDQQTYEQILDFLLSDMNALALLRHPNIVEYIDFIGIPDPKTGFPYGLTVLITEKCLGDLDGLLTLVGGPDEAFRKQKICLHWFRHIVSAVSYLHDLNVVHLDIKPDNILYTFTGAVPKRRALVLADVMNMVFKLTDFGQSKSYNVEEANPTIDQMMGSASYMSPEMLAIWRYKREVEVKPCDVYSLGKTLFRSHLGAQGYRFMDRKMRKVCGLLARGESTRIKYKSIDKRIAQFVYVMTRVDPEKRWTIQEIQNELNRAQGVDRGIGLFGTQIDINPMDPTGPKVRRYIRGAPNLKPDLG